MNYFLNNSAFLYFTFLIFISEKSIIKYQQQQHESTTAADSHSSTASTGRNTSTSSTTAAAGTADNRQHRSTTSSQPHQAKPRRQFAGIRQAADSRQQTSQPTRESPSAPKHRQATHSSTSTEAPAPPALVAPPQPQATHTQQQDSPHSHSRAPAPHAHQRKNPSQQAATSSSSKPDTMHTPAEERQPPPNTSQDNGKQHRSTASGSQPSPHQAKGAPAASSPLLEAVGSTHKHSAHHVQGREGSDTDSDHSRQPPTPAGETVRRCRG